MAQNVATKRGEMREAEGQSPIKDERPGETKMPDRSLHFEGLGNLDDFPDPRNAKSEEGIGTQCVILSDILTGAEGEVYQKGQIHRLSKLVGNYHSEDRDLVKSQVKRLVALNAIRHATPEEVEKGFVEVTAETESEATQAERARRMILETENESLRRQLADANITVAPVTETPPPATDPFDEG